MNKNGVAKNSLLNVLRTLMINVIPLVTYMYGARIFQTEGNGAIWFAQSYTSYFVMLGMLGIEKYGIREISKVRHSRQEMNHLAHEILILNFSAVLVSTCLFFASIFIIPKLHSYSTLLTINGATIILTAMGMNWLYIAEEDFKYITVKSCIVSGISLLALFMFVHEKQDLYLFVIIQIIASTGSNVLNFIHSKRYIDFRWIGNYKPFKHLKNVLILFCMTFFIEVFTHLDTTMIGFISGNYATGLYSSAHKISGVLTAVITAAVMVIMPSMSLYAKENKRKEIIELSCSTINMILMLSIPFAIGLIVLSGQLNYIFSGAGFEEATLTGRILSGRVVLATMNGFFVMYLFIPLGKEKWNLISTGAAALLNLIMNSILIPYLAQNGAAIGTVAAEAIEMLINLYFLRRIMPLFPLFKNVWQYLLAALPIVPVTLLIKPFINNALFLVSIVAIVSTTTYFGVLFALKNPYLVAAIRALPRKRKAGY